MSRTTTKTETVTEEFDKDGNVTKRVTETTEETFEDSVPAPKPWTQPLVTFSQVTCRCNSGAVCYVHTPLINTQTTVPSATVRIADGQATFATNEGPVIIKGSSDLLKTVRVLRYDDSTVAQDAVSENVVGDCPVCNDPECPDNA